MKRILWNVTFASIITLVAYIVLYAVWGAILSEVENPTLKLFLIALMTTVAFAVYRLMQKLCANCKPRRRERGFGANGATFCQ